MSAPRRLLLQARLVLAAFLLSLGVAVAAPALRPVSLEMVCAGGAMQLVAHASDGGAAQGDGGAGPQVRSLLDCPLCVPAGLLPQAELALSLPVLPAHRVAPAPAAAVAVRGDGPAPARGPPALLALT